MKTGLRARIFFGATKSGLSPTHLFRHFYRCVHGFQSNDGTNSPALTRYAHSCL